MPTTTSTQSKAVIVNFSVSVFNPKKTDKNVTRQVLSDHNASEGSGKFVKQVLPEEAVEGIKQLVNEARAYHYEHSLPWAEEGGRIIPTARLAEYTHQMNVFHAAFNARVAEFVANYQTFIELARTRLGDIFSDRDYPSDVQNKFKFRLAVYPMPSVQDFRMELGAETVAIHASVNESIARAERLGVADLYRRVRENLTRVSERMSKPTNIFRDSLISNLGDLGRLIPALNITENSELGNLGQRLLYMSRKYQPEVLRENQQERASLKAEADRVLDAINHHGVPDDEEI